MPSISYDNFVPWANYHLTSGTRAPGAIEPRLEVEDMGKFHAGDLAGETRIERFAETTEQLWRHVGRIWVLHARKKALGELGHPAMPFPAALTGRGWSFSNIIGADPGKRRESMLLCEGLAGSIMLAPEDLVDGKLTGRIALAAGGTRFRELLDWAARRGRSVMTSGTHLGATVAGAIATATHGSRLGFGGIQDMIAGLHLVTGFGESVWIERKSEPVLTDAAAARLHPAGAAPVRIIRDDDVFKDALVHLGCMGIVNCAAVRLIDDRTYEVLKCDRRVDEAWLALVAAGKWQDIAAWLGVPRAPVFYEATLDPHDWQGTSALHTLYFETGVAVETGRAHSSVAGRSILSVGDAIARFGKDFSLPDSAALNDTKLAALPDLEIDKLDSEGEEAAELASWQPLPADMRVFDPVSGAQSAYDYYRITGSFEPAAPLSPPESWRDLHGDEITGGYPGSLYNASYAIKRADIAKAIPAITKRVAMLPRSFVFTLRFVSNPSGTLAFTRFGENCVIEIDGLSSWICRRTRNRLRRDSPTYAKDKRMLDYLEYTLPKGAQEVKRGLDAAHVDYSNHFGKRSYLDARKIARDFKEQIRRWRATRDDILATPLGRAIFWNWGAVNFGLLERPGVVPPDPPAQVLGAD